MRVGSKESNSDYSIAQDILSPDCWRKKKRAYHKYNKNIAMTDCLQSGYSVEPSHSGPVAGTWPACVSLIFSGLAFTHNEFQYNDLSSTVSYPFQARATDVANPCCSGNTPVTHPSFCQSFRFRAALKYWRGRTVAIQINKETEALIEAGMGFRKLVSLIVM